MEMSIEDAKFLRRILDIYRHLIMRPKLNLNIFKITALFWAS